MKISGPLVQPIRVHDSIQLAHSWNRKMPLSVLVLQSNESKLKNKVPWIGKDITLKVTTRAPFPGTGAAQEFIDVFLFYSSNRLLVNKKYEIDQWLSIVMPMTRKR